MAASKWTTERICATLLEVHGTTVTLKAGQAVLPRSMTFIDCEHGEWQACLYNVLKGSAHPVRALEKRKQTNLIRYGGHPAQNNTVKEKIKRTSFARYGASSPSKNAEVKKKLAASRSRVDEQKALEKRKRTCLERFGEDNAFKCLDLQEKQRQTCLDVYGVSNVFAAESVKGKIKATNIETHGVEYSLQRPEVRAAIKQTCLDVYGVSNVFASEYVKDKIKATNIEKYGCENPSPIYWQEHAHKLPNGLTLSNYMKQYGCQLRTATMWGIYQKHGFGLLQEYVEKGKTLGRITSLEHCASLLLERPVFGKTLPNRKKPDFKLSENLFLDIDGLYYHSIATTDYHLNKRLKYEESGLRLLQIREDELRNVPKIVKSMVAVASGNAPTLPVNACTLHSLPQEEATEFLADNDILGRTSFTNAFCLRNEGKIVALLTVTLVEGKAEFRVTNALNTDVGGGAETLINHVITTLNPSVLKTRCDLRYETGSLYEGIGFRKEQEFVDWCWTDSILTYPKTKEKQAKWRKLYDAGQRTYCKEIIR